MKNLFEYAKICLQQTDIEQKLSLTHQARQQQQAGQLCLADNGLVEPISATRFPSRPELRLPREMPKRKLNRADGVAAMFHALAHIEFMAIYLAWDVIYRFRGLPAAFYGDWLKVADEEAQHFSLIRSHLRGLGMDYGDLPAHAGLWEHAENTAEHLLARLAVVPRCMEARGLDVTPPLIEKFMVQNDQASVALLRRILDDEVGHVAIGSFWFKTLCQQTGLEPESTYQKLLGEFYQGKPKSPFNRELRLLAGFSNAEIDWLETR
jgi:uncharacterized ferritin-like protein (DUF455 family)